MKKTILFVFITLFISNGYSQTNDIQSFIEKGIQLHDNGDYKGAIEQYKKALKIDKNSAIANYEIASSYFALKDYKKAIEYADIIINSKSNYADYAYILKGSALDILGKSKESINVYKEGIKEFPNNYLLYYNIALTYYNLKDFKNSETNVQKALVIKPTHPSSHFLLGLIMNDEGNRVKSLLALYNFLLLEPTGERAKNGYNLLITLLKKGVRKDSESSTTISISDNKSSDEFRAAELMVSLLEASKSLKENANKTEFELFTDNTKSFFSVLGELKKDNNGFWWDFYVDFFYAMINANYNQTFCYYISQSNEDEKINSWVNTNKDKVEELINWSKSYERKN